MQCWWWKTVWLSDDATRRIAEEMMKKMDMSENQWHPEFLQWIRPKDSSYVLFWYYHLRRKVKVHRRLGLQKRCIKSFFQISSVLLGEWKDECRFDLGSQIQSKSSLWLSLNPIQRLIKSTISSSLRGDTQFGANHLDDSNALIWPRQFTLEPIQSSLTQS